MKPVALAIAAACCLGAAVAQERPNVFTGIYENGQFQSLTFVNSISGWDTFFNAGYLGQDRVIANVEAGLIWSGHEAFLRPPGISPAVTMTYTGPGAIAEADFHATMVGHMLAGTGYIAGTNPPQFTFAGIGMAPYAQLWSGAIATSYSQTDVGSFETEDTAAIPVYRQFFQGIGGVKPDAINSSWGGLASSASDATSVAIDGLARQNPTVAFVAAAGNGGAGTVFSPGAVFNGITVGSLGGTDFRSPSTFSSRGAADFFNPVTGVTQPAVRAAVDIAAPGENLVLAAYLGPTGGIGASTEPAIQNLTQDPAPTNLYFLNQDGTSFAAPAVSGAIALIRQVAATHPSLNFIGTPTAEDSRVIKSVLMAGADRPTSWNNGQYTDLQGIVRTTQGLDLGTGAGAMNLDTTVGIYFFGGTRDIAGSGGGTIASKGWDFGNVAAGGANEYVFDNPFSDPVELTLALNWFSGTSFNNTTGLGESLHLSNLNLQLWSVVNGSFASLVASSETTYNNAEFLRLVVPAGSYGVRVTFDGTVYETAPVLGEDYALAWEAIPEPSALMLFATGLVLVVLARRNIRAG